MTATANLMRPKKMGPLGKRNARLTARMIASDPLRFALQVMRSFRANQGFLLAGAVAYYTLLSVVPLFLLSCY
ncbi:hypothetical protein ACFS07_16145 [Undibacterium arcticum]